MNSIHAEDRMTAEQGQMADRKCLRVAAPQGLLLEAALWVRPPEPPARLHLLELGRPVLRCAAGDPALALDDVSANGLRMTLARPQDLGPALPALAAGDCLCLLYLKLAQPLSSPDELPLTLFLGAAPVSAHEDGGRLLVALNIIRRGQPERDDKALTLYNVSGQPIRELAAWCDEVARMERAEARQLPRGLRLGRLMHELDALPERVAEAASPLPPQDLEGH
jgi:hypothetical protein